MKKKSSLALAMASLALTGVLSGCHVDKEQIEEIKATLSSEELAQITRILTENGIVIGADGIDIPASQRPVIRDPSQAVALYGAPSVFVKPAEE